MESECEIKKILFDVCRLFFVIFRFRSHFRLVWIDPYVILYSKVENKTKQGSKGNRCPSFLVRELLQQRIQLTLLCRIY